MVHFRIGPQVIIKHPWEILSGELHRTAMLGSKTEEFREKIGKRTGKVEKNNLNINL